MTVTVPVNALPEQPPPVQITSNVPAPLPVKPAVVWITTVSMAITALAENVWPKRLRAKAVPPTTNAALAAVLTTTAA